jgi:hypothetical protein
MRSLVVATVATLGISIVSGCASQRQAPFHVYQSPLLAAQSETPRAPDRDFDPARPGDYPAAERVVAQNDDDRWEETKPAVSRSRGQKARRPRAKRKKRPALSIGGRGSKGSSSAESSDFDTRRAAEYLWRTLEINGVAPPASAKHSIPLLWEHCKANGKTHQKSPLPGDVAFFHNAFDANADGRNNDWYTHVGVVVDVDAYGTADVLSWKGGKVRTIKLNVAHPDEAERDGEVINSRLRTPTADDAPFTQYHAGQLFAGWCTILDGKKDVIIMDAWAPGE